jgi:hypothetical protein
MARCCRATKRSNSNKMASSFPTSLDFSENDLMNHVVRMVTPLRREFSRSLDVAHFMRDVDYATEILALATNSKDERLRQYGVYLQTKLLGPRNGTLSKSDPPPPVPADSAPAAAPSATADEPTTKGAKGSEAQLRSQMLAKYRSGLR